jgi:hypothetical protein
MTRNRSFSALVGALSLTALARCSAPVVGPDGPTDAR